MSKVSIIVPIYNVEQYLRRCLDTLVMQTHEDLEIILVNDGTKDNSLSIMEEYQKQYPSKVFVYSKENGGLSDARNYGIQYATGDYLSFIDSDDWVDLTMIEKLHDAIVKHQADIAICDMEYIYDDQPSRYSSCGDFDVLVTEQHPEVILLNNSACNKLFKKELFQSIRFPKGQWYEDLATIPQIMYLTHKIVKVSEPLYKYYQRSSSISHSADIRIFDIYQSIEDIKRDILTQPDCERRQKTLEEIHKLFIIHGLDLTTVRIKDFDEKQTEYLSKNMEYLNQHYPDWRKNPYLKQYSWKKKLIFFLLRLGFYKAVLILYQR